MSSSLAVVLTTLLGGRAFAERYGESLRTTIDTQAALP